MESIKGHDKYLDPPEEPTHWECNECGVIYDGGGMIVILSGWFGGCPDCHATGRIRKVTQ